MSKKKEYLNRIKKSCILVYFILDTAQYILLRCHHQSTQYVQLKFTCIFTCTTLLLSLVVQLLHNHALFWHAFYSIYFNLICFSLSKGSVKNKVSTSQSRIRSSHDTVPFQCEGKVWVMLSLDIVGEKYSNLVVETLILE